MVVWLNLLKDDAHEKKRLRLNSGYWLGLCVFILSASLLFGFLQVCRLRGLREQGNAAERQLHSVREQGKLLDIRLGEMMDSHDKEENKLDFMLSGITLIDTLSALTALANGVIVNRLQADVEKVIITGRADSFERVSIFNDALRSSGLFSSVSKPAAVDREGADAADGFSFTFSCKPVGLYDAAEPWVGER